MNLFSDEPNPYVEDRRIRAMKVSIRKAIPQMAVWCETGKCPVIRVFKVRQGLLVQCKSEANIAEMRDSDNVVANSDWSKRRAFFLTDDLLEQQLTLVCDCMKTTERVVPVAGISLLWGTTRNASIRDLV